MSRPTSLKSPSLLLALLALTSACPEPQKPDDTPDAGGVADACNSPEEALTLAECELTEDQARSAYLGAPGDEDWYSFRVPADANARTLLRVFGAYDAPSTAVNLSVRVLRESGVEGVASGVDRPGQGAPRPVELILPFAEPGARLLLHVSDASDGPTPAYDVKSPYSLLVQVEENPDPSEPNDTVPTVLPLSADGEALRGQATGALATAGDVDLFSFEVPAGREVLWLRVSGPSLSPPAAYRMAYTLLAPDGTPVSEGRVSNEFLPVDLATARRVQEGTYTLRLEGRKPNWEGPVPGDLRLQYQVQVALLTEEDENEPNDTLAASPRRILSVGGPAATFTGRLGTVPDPDWYTVDLTANTEPTLLHYRWRPAGGGGRFPALPGRLDRQVRLFTQVTLGDTAEQRQHACLTRPEVCPRGEAQALDHRDNMRALVDGFCRHAEGARCLQAQRREAEAFTTFRNMEGVVPVPPHSSTVTYHFVVEDEGNDFADDREYVLEVRWLADPDEAARVGVPMVQMPRLGQEGFPVPPAGAAELTGQLRAGYGRLRGLDFEQGEGVRGFDDYDAVPTDEDTYVLQLPSVAAPEDQAWALQWSVERQDGGVVHDLALELEFCDGDNRDGGVCTPVSTTSIGEDPLVLLDPRREALPWQKAGGSAAEQGLLFTRESTEERDTTTATAFGCYCIEPRFMRGGTLKVKVLAVDREGYGAVDYRVRTSLTDYPTSYPTDGGTETCPAPQLLDAGTDGGQDDVYAPGCRFTAQ